MDALRSQLLSGLVTVEPNHTHQEGDDEEEDLFGEWNLLYDLIQLMDMATTQSDKKALDGPPKETLKEIPKETPKSQIKRPIQWSQNEPVPTMDHDKVETKKPKKLFVAPIQHTKVKEKKGKEETMAHAHESTLMSEDFVSHFKAPTQRSTLHVSSENLSHGPTGGTLVTESSLNASRSLQAWLEHWTGLPLEQPCPRVEENTRQLTHLLVGKRLIRLSLFYSLLSEYQSQYYDESLSESKVLSCTSYLSIWQYMRKKWHAMEASPLSQTSSELGLLAVISAISSHEAFEAQWKANDKNKQTFIFFTMKLTDMKSMHTIHVFVTCHLHHDQISAHSYASLRAEKEKLAVGQLVLLSGPIQLVRSKSEWRPGTEKQTFPIAFHMSLMSATNATVQVQQMGQVQGFAFCPGLPMDTLMPKRQDPIDRLIEAEKSKFKPKTSQSTSGSRTLRPVPCSVPILAGKAKYCELHYLKWMERSTVRRPEFAHGGPAGGKQEAEKERPKKEIYIHGTEWLSTDGFLLGEAQSHNDDHHSGMKPKSSVFANDHEKMEKMKAYKAWAQGQAMYEPVVPQSEEQEQSPAFIEPGAIQPSACPMSAVKRMGFDPSFERKRSYHAFLKTLPTPQLARGMSRPTATDQVDLTEDE